MKKEEINNEIIAIWITQQFHNQNNSLKRV